MALLLRAPPLSAATFVVLPVLLCLLLSGSARASDASAHGEGTGTSPRKLTDRRPQFIIFLFADDMGYGDLPCYGHPYTVTPNICEGIGGPSGTVFTNFHVTGATCSPSRTGCMTSRSPSWYPNYMADFGFQGVKTVTELLRDGGYSTAHFGKWHIGPDDLRKSGEYGIDHLEIIGGGGRSSERGRDYDVYEAAIEHLEQHVATHGSDPDSSKPLYMNVWGHISHSPVVPPDSAVDKWRHITLNRSDFGLHMQNKIDTFGNFAERRMQEYVAELDILDGHVGRLLAKCDELGIRDDTLIVFSSDQGASPSYMGSGGVYQGQKFGFNEGGVRVPFLASWPGHIPAGVNDDNTLLSCLDWAPTLCTLAQLTNCPRHLMEGEDVSEVLLGLAPPNRPRIRPLFWKFSQKRSDVAVLYDKWKFYDPRVGDPELYDLEANPEETLNIAAERPDIVEMMLGMVEQWEATLPDEYCGDDCKKALPFDPFQEPAKITVPDALVPPTPMPTSSPSRSPASPPVPTAQEVPATTVAPPGGDGENVNTEPPQTPVTDDSNGIGPPTSESGGSNLDVPGISEETNGDGSYDDSSDVGDGNDIGSDGGESPPRTASLPDDDGGTAASARSSAARWNPTAAVLSTTAIAAAVMLALAQPGIGGTMGQR